MPVRLLHGRNVTGQGTCGNALDAEVTTRPYTPAAPTSTPTPYAPPPPYGRGGDYVPIYSISGKGAAVDVTLGSQPLRMLIDTGATMMSLPSDVAMALITSGDAEFGPKESFRLADGSIREEWTIIIHRMTIGSHVLTNVTASIAPTGATPLLGFTILNRVGRFTIDMAAGQLTFG
jgi:clan AA aspartic protease (TIGR02281 family)